MRQNSSHPTLTDLFNSGRHIGIPEETLHDLTISSRTIELLFILADELEDADDYEAFAGMVKKVCKNEADRLVGIANDLADFAIPRCKGHKSG